MKRVVIGLICALALVMVASGMVQAKEKRMEILKFDDIDELTLTYYMNLTGDESESRRYYIDRYYDVDDNYGDGEVTQDELDSYANNQEDNWEGEVYYFTLNGVQGEVDDCEVTLLGGLGPVDTTSLLSIKYEFDISFNDVDDEEVEYILSREEAFSYVDEHEIALTSPEGTTILSAFGLRDEDVSNTTVSGELRTDEELIVTFTGDSDGDGYLNDDDAFPENPAEWDDTDGDGRGDNSDEFPNDANEWKDSDGDGHGDNSDKFKADSTEWVDSDGDGHGDNSDTFPANGSEWADSDKDGYGDNSDEFPYDNQEWVDSDKDGVGDNSDAFPNDASASVDHDNDGKPETLNPGHSESTTNLELDEPEVKEVEKEGVAQTLSYVIISVLCIVLLFFLILTLILIMAVRKKDQLIAQMQKMVEPEERYEGDGYDDEDEDDFVIDNDYFEKRGSRKKRGRSRRKKPPRRSKRRTKRRRPSRERRRKDRYDEEDFW